MTRPQRITLSEYRAFDDAYDFFNGRLFAGELPPCLITLQRKAHSRGYFCNDRFHHRKERRSTTHELALNPDTFDDRTDKEILSTLVHEMVHCWQQHFGRPSRGGYHNREWAERMIEVGLMPSHTGERGGNQTGQHVTHYIIRGGEFDRGADELLKTGFRLNWQSLPEVRNHQKDRSKTKYTCQKCGQNAWAKPDANLMCGDCLTRMEEQLP